MNNEQNRDQRRQKDILDRFERSLPQPVQRVETHASVVFLTGTTAYKIKRSVQYPYLDYSTVEKRKAACEREFAVNVAIAPELYIRTTPLVADKDGGVSVSEDLADSDADRLDWAVVMHRFDSRALLSDMARVGDLSPDMILKLTDRICEFHGRAQPVLPGQQHGGGAVNFREQFDQIFKGLSDRCPDRARMTLMRCVNNLTAFLAANQSQMDRRMAEGLVRHCHGDLHLGNICVLDAEPMPFDAIEFSDAISNIDILYDVSFLWMDLLQLGQTELCNLSFNRYFQRMNNHWDVGLVPLFMAVRALVRARVSLDRLQLFDGSQILQCESEAVRYIELADRLITVHGRELIAVGGLSGSGKTTVARQFAADIRPHPGAIHLRSDVIRKAMFAVEETDALPEEAYSPQVSQKVYGEMLRLAGDYLEAGWPVIIDAVFSEPAWRNAAETLAEKHKVPFVGLWLDAEGETRIGRVGKRIHDALDAPDASDADERVAAGQRLNGGLSPAWNMVPADGNLTDTLAMAQKPLRPFVSIDADQSPSAPIAVLSP